MTDLATTRALLHDLIAIPTVSADSNLEMIALLANRLGDHGAEVEIMTDDTGKKANLLARIGPDEPGGILLSGHSDVVPVADQDWSRDPFDMWEDGGKLFGRGTCDMKGFIAAATVMAREYAQLPLKRPLHFAFTYDEEVGCLGARALVPELQKRGLKPAMAIIGEPTMMRVIEGHKGCCEYTVRFAGLAGHGSAPERGVNAAEYAVRYVSHLMGLRGDLMMRAPKNSRFDPPWTTINIGGLNAGVAHNVIAGWAEVAWEMRPVQKADQDFVKKAIETYVERDLLPAMRSIHPASAIDTEVIGEVSGMEIMDENEARDLVTGLVGANGADVVPFGTEAGLFQEMGMSVAVCGPGSIDQAHKPDEYLSLDQLSGCLTMLEGLGRKLTA